MKKMIQFLFCISFLGCLDLMAKLPDECASASKNFGQSLKCAQHYFTVDGKRVNPRIIQDLNAWISDSGTQVYSISLLESQNSNRYFCNDISQPITAKNCNTKEGESFDYHLVGKVAHDIFALQTEASGGGFGTFYTLLLVRIKEANSIGEVDKYESDQTLNPQHKMILIEKVGSLLLGDRTGPEVKVNGNKIVIKKCEDNCAVNSKQNEIIIHIAD